MHRLINLYINSNDDQLEGANQFLNPKNQLENALLLLFRSWKDLQKIRPLEHLLEKAVQSGHKDSQLYYFFMLKLSIYYLNTHQIENAISIVSILNQMENSNTPHLLLAFYYQVKGSCARAQFNYKEGDRLFKESIKNIHIGDFRFDGLLDNYSDSLSKYGLLKTQTKINYDHITQGVGTQRAATSIFINNAIFNCCPEDITEDILNAHTKMVDVKVSGISKPEEVRFALEIISGNLDYPYALDDKRLQTCLKFYKQLRAGKEEDALETYRTLSNASSSPFYFGLLIFVNLHHAVISMNPDIITNIDKANPSHRYYFDDFFIGRYYFKKGNKPKARQHFSRMIKTCQKRGALGRLYFELQFCPELKAHDLFGLLYEIQIPTRGLSNPKIIGTNLKKKKSSNLSAIDKIIGNSTAISNVKQLIRMYAKTDQPILILGETGTGKELVAKAIHEESGSKKEPFLVINSGAISDTLLQSELFGYEAGAFTGALKKKQGIFEAAGKGTVFLDEFADVSPSMQTSLLRVLENKEIRPIGSVSTKKIECKIIMATNKKISEMVTQKLFRQDLYFRLSQFLIQLPPLRERTTDIDILVDNYLNKKIFDGNRKKASAELISKMHAYYWPGNVRELIATIEKMLVWYPFKDVYEPKDTDLQSQIPMTNAQINVEEKTSSAENNEDEIFAASSEKKRQQRLKSLFSKHMQMNRVQASKALDVSLITAGKDLKALIKEGFIHKVTPTKSPRSHYFKLS